MGVVQKAVEDGIRDRGVADPPMPVFDGQLRGNDSGVFFGAVVHDFEQIFAAVRL